MTDLQSPQHLRVGRQRLIPISGIIPDYKYSKDYLIICVILSDLFLIIFLHCVEFVYE